VRCTRGLTCLHSCVCVTGPAGQYSTGGGSNCVGCLAGYECPNGTAVLCGVGKFATGGAASCSPCPAGVFGNTTGLTSANCTAACDSSAAPGFYCSAGSSSVAGSMCTCP
jgi:hypothetical protein